LFVETLQPLQYWDGSLAGAIILSGLVIVFIALIIVIGVVQATGKLANKAAMAPKPPQAPSAPPAQKAAAPAPAVAPTIAPVVQQGIAGETVAVISAAVAAMMETEAPGVAYEVSSIQPRTANRAQRPVWGFAGMQQNTRPF
jgi:Na+-transporting methylmalonyl-CoA/oxaloacetate decarboxylase gamma subunit